MAQTVYKHLVFELVGQHFGLPDGKARAERQDDLYALTGESPGLPLGPLAPLTDLPCGAGFQQALVSPMEHEAWLAFIQDDFTRVLDLTGETPTTLAGWILRVGALAHIDLAQARDACAQGVMQYSSSDGLHRLHAQLLSDLVQ